MPHKSNQWRAICNICFTPPSPRKKKEKETNKAIKAFSSVVTAYATLPQSWVWYFTVHIYRFYHYYYFSHKGSKKCSCPTTCKVWTCYEDHFIDNKQLFK